MSVHCRLIHCNVLNLSLAYRRPGKARRTAVRRAPLQARPCPPTVTVRVFNRSRNCRQIMCSTPRTRSPGRAASMAGNDLGRRPRLSMNLPVRSIARMALTSPCPKATPTSSRSKRLPINHAHPIQLAPRRSSINLDVDQVHRHRAHDELFLCVCVCVCVCVCSKIFPLQLHRSSLRRRARKRLH